MKKIGLLSVAIIATLSLAACGSKNGDNKLTAEQITCRDAIATHIDGFEATTDGEEVTNGKLVTVNYVGRLSAHELFDTSVAAVATGCDSYQEGRDYSAGLPFVVGEGQMIKGFEEAVKGMHVGESKTITLTPDMAYGERDEKKIVPMPKDQLPAKPDGGEWAAGDELPTFFGPMPIKEVKGEEVMIDTNHPLAGETLTFDITIVSVADPEDVADSVEDIEEVLEDAAEEVEETAEDIADAAEEVAEDVVDTVEEAVEDTADAVEDIIEEAAEAVEDINNDTPAS